MERISDICSENIKKFLPKGLLSTNRHRHLCNNNQSFVLEYKYKNLYKQTNNPYFGFYIKQISVYPGCVPGHINPTNFNFFIYIFHT